LTPEVPADKALALVLGRLDIRCPRCAAIVVVTESLTWVLLKTGVGAIQDQTETFSRLVLEARAELEKRKREREMKQQAGAHRSAKPDEESTNPDPKHGETDERLHG
jgi:hypothetical protein